MNLKAAFPQQRLRRLRRTPALRRLVRQTALEPGHLVAPLFVTEESHRREVASMPGVFRLPVSEAAQEARALSKLGVGGVLLFGIPKRKDEQGSRAFAPDGVVQRAVRAVKKAAPKLAVITDVCLCEYTTHGHCGLVRDGAASVVDNDASLPALGRIAVSQARAGADVVAPSAMMDGQVGAIRRALDGAGFRDTAILSYSAKFASALYGPFRDAAESSPRFGDRRGYQMDPANSEEALRETALDIREGADIVMVKPALGYLDVLARVKETFHWPTAVYQVSGEYALIKAAAARGWVDERRAALEAAVSMRRAGADLIITYYAKQLAQWLLKKEEE